MDPLMFLVLVLAAIAEAKPLDQIKPGPITSSQSEAMPTPTFGPLDRPSPIALAEDIFSTFLVPSKNPELIVTSTVTPIVAVRTTSTISGVMQILPSPGTLHPETLGTVLTTLDMLGHATNPPVIQTQIPSPTKLISPASVTLRTGSIESTPISHNIFQPIATDSPPSVFSTRPDHPVPRKGIKSQTEPLSTNKFYSNFYLGSQTAQTWTHPYSLSWVKGGGSLKSWGMSITQLDASQKVYGPDASANPVGYFTHPLGILSLVLSSSELKSSTCLTTDSLTSMSANVNLHPDDSAPAQIVFPLVQGMGFVTAVFNSGTPTLESATLFRTFTKFSSAPKPCVSKFKMILEDDTTWLLYAYSPSGADLDFTVVSNDLIQATSEFEGTIQIAKIPSTDTTAEHLYDAACGAFATSVDISGSADGESGSYTFSFAKGGLANTTLAMFALPHHISSLSPETSASVSTLQLETTTKGKATAIIADSWTMLEKLPTDMGFGPWNPQMQKKKYALSAATIKVIHTVACSEISQNMTKQTDLDSIYFSGKALAKFAGITYTLQELLGDPAMAQAGLENLKDSFALFSSNTNKFPLLYESAWKGIVSSATYSTGDPGVDFGNTYYNDHHFHYGYFILTAAIIGSMDPSWVSVNKAYVNTLVRDIANPSELDPYFPVSRSFDWYHGHSWAHGLYESFDGKDQESSSEDSMSAYALKMWGHVSGDSNMEARGNLQLAINARSIQNYYLYLRDNMVEPRKFTGNRVAGIMFENKIDYTTFFGSRPELIHGIHMLPLLPSSGLTRTQPFVQQEWDDFFSQGRVDSAQGGWKSLLYANLAFIDAKSSWNYFSSSTFNDATLDGGASRTWYMALAAGNLLLSLSPPSRANRHRIRWQRLTRSLRAGESSLPGPTSSAVSYEMTRIPLLYPSPTLRLNASVGLVMPLLHRPPQYLQAKLL
ncbi:endo-1,3-beta-glucanase [Blumeria hordei DH14]|uniref:glucan endo-1,3-beta-D-glucosidase n=1 Tax=Blumeria graminis f. sp. hordei (strain DH14) TaxID=546991 RepID=N1JG37_BLUG1|nr:endo-1,3-beta-glucanase [Blumeria hordei DH14]